MVIHLPREAEHGIFEKIVSDRRHISHVTRLREKEELQKMKPFLREGYEYSVS